MKKGVSIICPYRDSARFLPGLIANVKQQTYKNWELLLIDDESVDEGSEIAEEAAHGDSRIRCLTSPSRPSGYPQGPWWPRNLGLTSAKHELVAFLDADDRWHPAKLDRQLRWHEQNGVRISVTGYARFNLITHALISWRLSPPQFGYKTLRNGNAIPMLTLMIERDLLGKGFEPSSHEDYLLWLTVFRKNPGLECVTIPELLGFYAVHETNLTSRRWVMPLWAYGVFRAHGMGRLESCGSLIPWALAQASTQWRSIRNPLNSSLKTALSAMPPLPLPPQ